MERNLKILTLKEAINKALPILTDMELQELTEFLYKVIDRMNGDTNTIINKYKRSKNG